MATIRLVIPEELKSGVEAAKEARKLDISSLRIGLLDNSKANADHLLNMIADRVKKEFNVANVVMQRKPRASSPAIVDVIETLTRETDFVISAMAD
jgi:hypothetical protein